MKPEGMCRSWRRYRRTVSVTRKNTSAATIHTISTCLVTERSTPKTFGNWNSG